MSILLKLFIHDICGVPFKHLLNAIMLDTIGFSNVEHREYLLYGYLFGVIFNEIFLSGIFLMCYIFGGCFCPR